MTELDISALLDEVERLRAEVASRQRELDMLAAECGPSCAETIRGLRAALEAASGCTPEVTDSGPSTENQPMTDEPTDAVEFLDGVYSLDRLGRPRPAVARVIDFLDDLLCRGRFRGCDEVLAHADETRLSPSSIVSILGITFAARGKLNERRAFYARALEQLRKIRGDSGAERLLGKYE